MDYDYAQIILFMLAAQVPSALLYHEGDCLNHIPDLPHFLQT